MSFSGPFGDMMQSAFGDRMDMSKNRLSICQNCSLFNESTHVCSECHCFMPVKTRLKGSSCPIGKWKREE